jgi:hypothetical protein
MGINIHPRNLAENSVNFFFFNMFNMKDLKYLIGEYCF